MLAKMVGSFFALFLFVFVNNYRFYDKAPKKVVSTNPWSQITLNNIIHPKSLMSTI